MNPGRGMLGGGRPPGTALQRLLIRAVQDAAGVVMELANAGQDVIIGLLSAFF